MSTLAPLGSGEPPGIGLAESARRFGHYRWVEQRLFEVLGGWVAAVADLQVKVVLDTHSLQHAWHADLWRQRLPVLRDVDPDALTVPANDHVRDLFDELAAPSGGTAEMLVGAYGVVIPHLVVVYGDHLDRLTAAADAPAIRALGLVLRDDLDHWQQGQALLAPLLVGDDVIDRAAAYQAHLQKRLRRAGGVLGSS